MRRLSQQPGFGALHAASDQGLDSVQKASDTLSRLKGLFGN
jgi:hypothetical protein